MTISVVNAESSADPADDGLIGGLWRYFAPAGVATQQYWPPGVRGKLASFLHGRGWRITRRSAA